MPSNTLKRAHDSNNFQSSKKKTRSPTLFEKANKKGLRVKQQTVCEELISKLEKSMSVEDNKIIKAFKHHTVSKVGETTLKNLHKLRKTG